MCGISGYLDFDQGVNVAVLQRMNDVIRHRGPDDEGYLLINEAGLQAAAGNDTVAQLKGELPLLAMARYDGCFLGLGHRRLSILDLSPQGHQPMSSAHGRYSVAFNGEIYNYIELRQQLAEMGYVFHTDCDTEVLLRAYEAWVKIAFYILTVCGPLPSGMPKSKRCFAPEIGWGSSLFIIIARAIILYLVQSSSN